MNYKIKKLATNWKIIILVLFIILSVIAIHPTASEGVAIRSVTANSSASLAGIPQPKPTILPVSRERVTSIGSRPVVDVASYYQEISKIGPNRTIQIKTNRGIYKVTTKEELGTIDIGLKVYEAPTTNIRKGLDLQGGTRVLLQPEMKLSDFDLAILIDNMKQRLNVYGLSDLVVRDSTDLTGNQYIVVEIAGATEDEIKDLLAKQGKFEAKIANKTVFIGGRDIVYVGRSANEARIEGCNSNSGEYVCRFSFAITLSKDAAQRQADATMNSEIVTEPGQGSYLKDKIEFYLDDKLVDALNIVSDLKGKAETQIAITGAGIGNNQQEALNNAGENMKRLQTILVTGSLPIKLTIVKIDSISPALGDEFVSNAMLMSLLSILAVAVVIAVRYKRLIIAVPILITMLSEVLLLFGISAFIGWNIDMAAIAGILVVIGTGVDAQIVITDETLKGETSNVYNWKEKVKRAFLIIMLSYATVVVAMVPLIFAGAGLLKGFAVTTIIGVSIGVFVTRPAYSAFVEVMLK